MFPAPTMEALLASKKNPNMNQSHVSLQNGPKFALQTSNQTLPIKIPMMQKHTHTHNC